MINWWTNKDIDKLRLNGCITAPAHTAITESRESVKNIVIFAIGTAFIIGGMFNTMIRIVQ